MRACAHVNVCVVDSPEECLFIFIPVSSPGYREGALSFFAHKRGISESEARRLSINSDLLWTNSCK